MRLLNEMELPLMDGCVIITRSYRNGRSTSRINGETVTVAKVREIAASLIDIHGQHEHQSLLYPRYHLELVDSFADSALEQRKASCRENYRSFQEARRMLEQAVLEERDRARQIDLLSYEINEIDEAALREGEDEELEGRYLKLSNAQKILEAASQAEHLTGSDDGALMNISRAGGILARISSLDKDLEDLCSMLSQIEDLCGDFNRSLNAFLDDFQYDEEELDGLFDPLKEMTENGADAVVFRSPPTRACRIRPLQNVASGGELSRIMLGIKTVMANKDSIGTLIFDEIDTGISGRTAQKVSEKMAKLSRSRQVIAITHLAQIASMADAHYLIEKSVQDGVTRTHVRELDHDEMVGGAGQDPWRGQDYGYRQKERRGDEAACGSDKKHADVD